MWWQRKNSAPARNWIPVIHCTDNADEQIMNFSDLPLLHWKRNNFNCKA
jgi:hypothetical protein